MIDRDVTFFAIAVVALVGVFSVTQAFLGGVEFQPFTAFAILGPDQKMSDYPKSLKVGDNITLNLYIENHEGATLYYRVYVKLSDKANTVNQSIPLQTPAIAKYETILLNNQTYLKPITLSMSEPGMNQRLVFELWRYNAETKGFTFHDRWNQLWLNVTSS